MPQQGAVAFLEKPLNTSELLAAVEGVFKSQKKTDSPTTQPDARNEKRLCKDELQPT